LDIQVRRFDKAAKSSATLASLSQAWEALRVAYAHYMIFQSSRIM